MVMFDMKGPELVFRGRGRRGGGSPVFLGAACSVAVTNDLTTN
jgi:hypothetical protein